MKHLFSTSYGRREIVIRGCLYLLLLTALLAAQLSLSGYSSDDAYIHLRIVENFLNTGQPFYNPGEAVLVSSSYLWTILLTLYFSVTGVSVKAAAVLCAVIAIMAAAVWVTVLKRQFPSLKLPGEAIIALIFSALISPASFELMETPFAIMLLGIAVLLWDCKKPVAFSFLGLAAVTRLEYMVCLPVFFIAAILEGRFRVSSMVKYCAAVTLPVLLGVYFFYGTLIPSAVTAKTAVYQLTWTNFKDQLEFGIIGEMPNSRILFQYLCGALVVLLVGFAAEVAFIHRNTGPIKSYGGLVPAALSALLVFAFYTFRRILIFHWYLPLFIFPPVVLAVASYLKKRLWCSLGIVFVISAIPLVRFTENLIAPLKGPQSYMWFKEGARVRQYLDIGNRLHRMFPQAKVLTPEIGGIGYSFKGSVIDACGLASPASLAYHPLPVGAERRSGTTGAVPLKLVEDLRPEIIVSMEAFLGIIAAADISSEYQIFKFPVFKEEDSILMVDPSLWQGKITYVFIRKDLCGDIVPCFQ